MDLVAKYSLSFGAEFWRKTVFSTGKSTVHDLPWYTGNQPVVAEPHRKSTLK